MTTVSSSSIAAILVAFAAYLLFMIVIVFLLDISTYCSNLENTFPPQIISAIRIALNRNNRNATFLSRCVLTYVILLIRL